MKRLTTALKWFAYGLALGILFAPRSGKDTRSQLIQAARGYINQGLGQAAQTSQQVAQQVSSKIQQTANQASTAVEQAGTQASSAADQARTTLDQTGSSAQ